MSHVLIACDKFKGSASSLEIAAALSRGFPAGVHTEAVPVADGGDGTLEVCDALGHRRETVQVQDPYGEPVRAQFSWDPDRRLAVIEVAEAAGLRLVQREGALPPDRDAAAASSSGVGQLILAALDLGAHEVVLGLGGSATTDAGAGMAAALGAVFLDSEDRPITGVARLGEVVRTDLSRLDPRVRKSRFVIASDVTNPLTGPEGAAAVYGPQKGLREDQVPQTDAALGSFARTVEAALGTHGVAGAPGAGAAGGLGFMGLALLGAEYASGVELFLDLAGFQDRLEGADLVITGEGRIDDQTLSGKAPAGVAQRAAARGIPVIAVCGQNALAGDQRLFRRIHALSELEPDVRVSIEHPLPLLERLGRIIAEEEGLATTSSSS